MPSSRPRRLFLVLLSIPVLFLFLLYLGSSGSRRVISDLFSTSAHPSKLPDEIFGLLHFVTSPDEAGRVFNTMDDPTRDAAEEVVVQPGDALTAEKPVEMAWYALGSIAKTAQRTRGPKGLGRSLASGGWDERLKVLQEEYPLVVFSKSYCPYSKRAKRLLETYDLSPPPKIIEVDLRADSSHIKTLLTRLTRRSTFPNVILHGRSLGGSDDLMRLHEEDRLRPVMKAAGVEVRWAGEGDEDILL